MQSSLEKIEKDEELDEAIHVQINSLRKYKNIDKFSRQCLENYFQNHKDSILIKFENYAKKLTNMLVVESFKNDE